MTRYTLYALITLGVLVAAFIARHLLRRRQRRASPRPAPGPGRGGQPPA